MNSCELIGVVRRIEKDDTNNQFLVLEVNRPYLDNSQSFQYDYIKIYRWGIMGVGSFSDIVEGMQLAIRGHLINMNDETIVVSEFLKVLYYPKNIVV